MTDGSESSRKRIKNACGPCRKGKRKCDGGQPMCSLCRSLNKTCYYETRALTRRKRHWDRDYVSNLEDQVASLQSLRHQQNVGCNETAEVDARCTVSRASSDDKQRDEEADSSDHPDKFTTEISVPFAEEKAGSVFWTLNSCDGESFTGPPGVFPNPEAKVRRDAPSSSSSRGRLDTSRFDGRDALSKQPLDLVLRERLIRLFLENLNSAYQFVKEEEISFCTDVWDNDSPDQLLCCSMCAAGARFLDTPQAEDLSRELLKSVQRKSLITTCRNINIKSVQSLSILACCEMMFGEDTIGWMYNCMAAGLAQHLGLHVLGLEGMQDRFQAQRGNFSARVRTFWSFFMVDRLAGSVLGRQSTIPWNRVKIPSYSSTINVLSASIEDIVFDHQTQLWHLHEKLAEPLYAFNFDNLSDQARHQLLLDARQGHLEFFRKMDPRLKFNKLCDAEKAVLEFHISYHASLLIVNRPFTHKSSGLLLQTAIRSMTAVASAISRLIRQYRRANSFAYGPPLLIYHTFRAAIVHLLNSTSAQPETRKRSAQGLCSCIDALQECSSRYEVHGRNALSSLQKMAEKWKVAWPLPASQSTTLGPFEQSLQTFPASPAEKVVNNIDLDQVNQHALSSTEVDSDIFTAWLDVMCDDSILDTADVTQECWTSQDWPNYDLEGITDLPPLF